MAEPLQPFFRVECREPGCSVEGTYEDAEHAEMDGWVFWEGDWYCKSCWGEGIG